MTDVDIRAYRESDRAYVTSTWVASLRSDLWSSADHPGERDSYHGRLIDRFLDRPDLDILVACDRTDRDRIIGWCAVSRILGGRSSSVLHFVYVRKEPHRRRGVATRLLEAAGVRQSDPLVVTFQTRQLSLLASKYPSVIVIEPEEFLT